MRLHKNSNILAYTVNINNYDNMDAAPHTPQYPNIKYLALTDTDTVPRGWDHAPVIGGTIRDSRKWKIQQELAVEHARKVYGDNYTPDVTLYIDANVWLMDDWYAELMRLLDGTELVAYNLLQHKDNLAEHVGRMGNIKPSLRDDLNKELAKYIRCGVPKDAPVPENYMVLRVYAGASRQIDRQWWKSYCLSAGRDQPVLSAILYLLDAWGDFANFLPFDARNNDIYRNLFIHNDRKPKFRAGKRRVEQELRSTLPPMGTRLIPTDANKGLRVCVVTLLAGSEDMDEEYRWFYRTCISSISDFAARNKYDFYCLSEVDMVGEYPSPLWVKFEMEKLFGRYDVLMYLDGDVLVGCDATSPLDYYPTDAIIALDSVNTYPYFKGMGKKRERQYRKLYYKESGEELPKEWNAHSVGGRYINAGVMIIPKAFAPFCKKPSVMVDDPGMGEQTLWSLRTAAYPYRELHHKYNFGHLHMNQHLERVNNDMFMHFNIPKGSNKPECLKKVQEILAGKAMEGVRK